MGQCPNCGSATTDDQTMCLVCGTDLATGVQASAQSAGGGAGRPSSASARAAGAARPARASRSRSAVRFAEGSGIPFLAALTLTVLLYRSMGTLVPLDAYVYRLFRPAGGWIMSVVPALIAFAFLWTVVDLMLKFRLGRMNERDMERTEVRQLPELVTQEAPDITVQRLRGWGAPMLARPVGRRISGLLNHLATTDAKRAHELVLHQSDLDADLAAAGYRTVKLFIWAMPILGFIGTVLGISLAVGGFSDFLTTSVSIDQIDQVTAELGEVASGLSFAFDTTLLGLLSGLVASVASSGVQAREERVLTKLDELGLRIVASATPVTEKTPVAATPSAGTSAEEFDRMMHGRLQELSGQMDDFTRAVRLGLDGFLGEWAKLPPEVERVAADLGGLRQHLASAAKSTNQLVLETRVLLEGLNEASSRMNTGLTSSIGAVSQTVEGLGESLRTVSESLATSMMALSDRVNTSEVRFSAGLTNLQGAIDRSQHEGAVMLRSQSAAEDAMRHLTAAISELGVRLGEVRDAQAALAPVLSQLSGPLELRLMPAVIPVRAAPSSGA